MRKLEWKHFRQEADKILSRGAGWEGLTRWVNDYFNGTHSEPREAGRDGCRPRIGHVMPATDKRIIRCDPDDFDL